MAVTLTMGLVRAHWQWSQSPLAPVAVAMVWPGPGWWLVAGTQLETHMIQHLHSTPPLPASPAQFNVTTTCTIAISDNTTSTMGRHFIINILNECLNLKENSSKYAQYPTFSFISFIIVTLHTF